MSSLVKYSALGFSAVCLGLAADAAVGLGTAQWLADLCLTDASDDMSDMEMVTVTPGPLLALSLGFAGLGMRIIAAEEKTIALGLGKPTPVENAGILSALILTSAENGRTTEFEIANIYQVVTGHSLEEEVAALTFARYQATDPDAVDQYALEPVESALSRRRILAAALMNACVIGSGSPRLGGMIERFAVDIGATPDDVAAANTALQRWTATDSALSGAPLITLLRSKPLGLRPA